MFKAIQSFLKLVIRSVTSKAGNMFTLGIRLGLMGPQYTKNMLRSVQYHNTSTPVQRQYTCTPVHHVQEIRRRPPGEQVPGGGPQGGELPPAAKLHALFRHDPALMGAHRAAPVS